MDCKRSKNRLFGEEVYYNGCVSGWLKLKISTTLARGVVVVEWRASSSAVSPFEITQCNKGRESLLSTQNSIDFLIVNKGKNTKMHDFHTRLAALLQALAWYVAVVLLYFKHHLKRRVFVLK